MIIKSLISVQIPYSFQKTFTKMFYVIDQDNQKFERATQTNQFLTLCGIEPIPSTFVQRTVFFLSFNHDKYFFGLYLDYKAVVENTYQRFQMCMFSCKSSSNRMSGGKPNIKIIKSRIFLSLSKIIEAFYNNDATACIQVLSITETPYINVTFDRCLYNFRQ